MTRKQILIVIIAIAVLALLFGLWTYHNTKSPAAELSGEKIAAGTILPQPKSINAFQLINDQNKSFTNVNLKNHWTFVFFGFTNCTQICPTTLGMLNQMYNQLAQNHVQPMPQVLFISVDPEQDSPQVIHNYLRSFNPNFAGATGTKQQLDALTQQFNVVYAKVFPNGEQSHYSIDHSGTILLLNPAGDIYAIFSMPHDAKSIAQDYMTIVGKG